MFNFIFWSRSHRSPVFRTNETTLGYFTVFTRKSLTKHWHNYFMSRKVSGVTNPLSYHYCEGLKSIKCEVQRFAKFHKVIVVYARAVYLQVKVNRRQSDLSRKFDSFFFSEIWLFFVSIAVTKGNIIGCSRRYYGVSYASCSICSRTGTSIRFVSRKIVPLMWREFKPAWSYCSCCDAASKYASGITMGRNLISPSSSSPSRDKKWSTWSPNPPMLPSSTVMSVPCSSASCLTKSTSNGFMNRASATVTLMSGCMSSTSWAATSASWRRVPRVRIATRSLRCLPLELDEDVSTMPPAPRMTRPFPIGIISPARTTIDSHIDEDRFVKSFQFRHRSSRRIYALHQYIVDLPLAGIWSLFNL